MKKIFHTLSRSSLKMLEISLGILIVLMVGLGFMLWQMSRQPFDLMFAEKYIEHALSTEEYTVDFADVDLKWPNMKGPLRLGIQGMNVRTKEGAKALSVDKADIGVSTPYLFAGMIRPVSLYLSNPTFRLVQSDDGTITFLFQDDALKEEDRRPLAEQIDEALKALTASDDNSFLRRFRFLGIENARLMLRDAETPREIELSKLNATFRRTRHTVKASVDLLLNSTLNEGVGGLSLTLDYDRDTGAMKADTVFKNLGPTILSKLLYSNDIVARQAGVMNGRFAVALDAKRTMTDFSGQLSVRKAEIYWPQEYDTPLQMSALDMTLGFDPAQQRIDTMAFTATVQGVPLTANLAVQIKENGYDFLINATVPEIQQATLETFFPKSELDGQLAKWLVHKMDGGTFRNVTAKVPLSYQKLSDETGVSEWALLFSEANMHIAFEAEGVNLQYQDTLKPALDIKGHGFFDGKKLEVIGESGRIEDVQARDVKVVVDDVAVKGAGYAHIDVKAKGPLPTLLRYISDEPIAMGDDLPFKADDVKGIADIQVAVGLPTLEEVPKEEVKVKVTGTLTELMLPKVVEGLTLTDGPLALETLEGGFTLKGDAKLDGQPVTLDMTQYFNAEGREFLTKVDAKIVSNADLRKKFGVDLSDYISGDLPLDVAYLDNGKGKETVGVKGDLAPTTVHIKPFAYQKKPGVPGSLSLDAVMDKNVLTRVNNLQVDTKDLAINNASLTFRPIKSGGVDLSGGKIPSARIGKSAGSADFEITAANVLKITAKTPVFDAKPFLETSGRRKQEAAPADKAQPMTITLKADKVLALNKQEISGFTLYTQMDTDSDITRLEVSGKAGTSPVSVLFRPDPQTGKRSFRLETKDAGALLSAVGLYENVREGTLTVFGEPKEGDATTGNLYGTAQLENFRVVRAPGLAKLLSLMSLGGVRDLLGQQGIAFSKLESDFEWQFRPEGNLLLIENGRTSGSSVGLTFEGLFDRGADTTDLRGTIIPMTEINNVLKNIPLLGDLLTGGNGLIAATYTMKGPSSDPSVMVNPLSVLAPGFLRKILFEGGFNKPSPKTAQTEAPKAPAKKTTSNIKTAN